jgi:hypothetical protein
MKGAGKSNIQVHCAPSSPFANFPFFSRGVSIIIILFFSARILSVGRFTPAREIMFEKCIVQISGRIWHLSCRSTLLYYYEDY